MLSTLPDELILKIVSFLKDGDYISFANTNKRFLYLLSSERMYTELNLSTEYCIGDVLSMSRYLFSSPTVTAFTKLDLGHCYWFDPSQLTQLVIGLSSSLTSLHIQGTKLSSMQMATILKRCSGIVELSVSFLTNNSSVGSTFHNINHLTQLSLYGNLESLPKFLEFLCFCENLTSLHVEISDANDVFLTQKELDQKQRLHHYVPPLLPVFESLKKIKCGTRHGGNSYTSDVLLEEFVQNIVSTRTPNLCDVFWTTYGDPRALFLYSNEALLVTEEHWSTDHPLFYQELRSLCIRPACDNKFIFSRPLTYAIAAFPNLKMMSCSYDPKAFLPFARSHSDLRVLQFGEPFKPCKPFMLDAPIAGQELAEGLSHLERLEKFSTDPRYFELTPNDAGCQPYSMNDPLNLAIVQLSTSCAFLNEIEIGVYATLHQSTQHHKRDHVCQVNSSVLQMISGCSNLEKLSLANLDVDSASYLHHILAGCRKLQSLRLTNIHSNANPVLYSRAMVDQLKIGLPLSKNLQDFRWEIGQSKNMFKIVTVGLAVSSLKEVNLADLLDTLKVTSSLRRFVPIADYTVHLGVAGTGALDWPSLILACIISPAVEWYNCQLKIKSNHPGFQNYFGASKKEAAEQLDVSHFNDMILFDTNVAKMPY